MPNDWENAERARHAYETYFQSAIIELEEKLNLQGLSTLSLEIIQLIVQLSWPCALHPVLVAMAEASELQKLIVPYESTSRQLMLSGNKLFVRRVTRAGISYIIDISDMTTPELVWDGGPVTEMVTTSDGIGIVDIDVKGCKTTALKRRQNRGQWYKSIRSFSGRPLDQVTIQSQVWSHEYSKGLIYLTRVRLSFDRLTEPGNCNRSGIPLRRRHLSCKAVTFCA